ncbi:FAD-dependent oxidoreductase [Candidatus Poribacteria bacterium]
MIEQLYDVAVIGGGLCGFASAVRAAENGKQVLLVERRPTLGWESAWACQLALDGSGSTIARRIGDELEKTGGLKQGRMDAPILEMVLDRLATKAGISVLLYSYPVRLISENDEAFGVVIGNKSGEQIVKARVIVDATEEALLWRQTDINEWDAVPPARQAVFFNHAEDGMQLPMELDGITINPSVWDGEVCVEFQVEKFDRLAAVRKIPDVLKTLREEVPQLKDALVTHAGNEPFPMAPLVRSEHKGIAHPEIKNLFGAGIWASETENTPTGRLSLGEEVGEMASECQGVKEFPPEMVTGSLIGQTEVMSDVLVIGGGTGGAIAAIAAGREGAKTTLIEISPCLGGIGTGGAIHSYYHGINGGIQDEVDQRVKDLTPLFAGKWKVGGFHPGVKKLVLQQMVEEANVDILLDTVVTGVLGKGAKTQDEGKAETETSVAIHEGAEERNEIQSVIAVSAEGIASYKAKVFIDSTGDGDVAVMAGAPFIIGRERDNLPHAYSQSSGKLNNDGNLAHNNFDAGYVDPSDVEDLTRGRKLGVNQYWRDKFTEGNRLLYLAPIIGLRQSRQIVGEYQLTLADEVVGRRFEDAVSFTIAHYDNHHHDYENESDEAALWVWALGNWSERIGCEVPYRCLIPKNVDNLILACRALSMTYDAHMEFRMQNDIQRIGEVAGVAAAMAAQQGLTLREIDVKELQAMMKKSGILDEKYRPKPAIQERKVPELPAPDEVDAQTTKELVWLSSQGGTESALALKDMLNSNDPQTRFRASAALAWHGLDAGIPELLKAVEEREELVTEGRRETQFWQAAIPFLGMAKAEDAVPVLIGVLKDEKAGLDALIGAVRALGRIGDESAVPALRDFLKREELPTTRIMNSSMGTTDDARWQIELSAAEALSKLGAPDAEARQIIKSHLDDGRAYVRRYANRLIGELGG